MYIVFLGWIYVVLMMAVAEAMSTQGTVLGAVFTFLFYGVLPLSIVMYVMATPQRRRARLAAERAADRAAESARSEPAAVPPDGGGQAAGDAVAPERKEA
jgi:hypothetical protein